MQQLVEQKNGPVGAKARLLRPLRWAALTLTGIVLIAIAGNVRLHSVLQEPLNYPLFFDREGLERGDSGRCPDSHWCFEPFGWPVPAVGGR